MFVRGAIYTVREHVECSPPAPIGIHVSIVRLASVRSFRRLVPTQWAEQPLATGHIDITLPAESAANQAKLMTPSANTQRGLLFRDML